MPGPLLAFTLVGTRSRLHSHAASRSALALPRSASMVAPVTRLCGWSRAAASSARHGVIRVHDRSVSPGW